jgi:hypothetical protein
MKWLNVRATGPQRLEVKPRDLSTLNKAKGGRMNRIA